MCLQPAAKADGGVGLFGSLRKPNAVEHNNEQQIT